MTQANGTAEREAAIEMLAELPGASRKTLGADKAYDTESFVESCRLSRFARKLIETVFGDAKQHGIMRQVKLRRLAKVELADSASMNS